MNEEIGLLLFLYQIGANVEDLCFDENVPFKFGERLFAYTF